MALIQYTEKRMSQQLPTLGEGRNRTSGAKHLRLHCDSRGDGDRGCLSIRAGWSELVVGPEPRPR
jgi:hypothetical protein